MIENSYNLFNTTILSFFEYNMVDEYNQKTDDYIVNARKTWFEQNKTRKDSYGISYHSDTLLEDDNFSYYHNLILNSSISFIDNLGYDISNHTPIINQTWVQEFSEYGGGHHNSHIHSNSHVCAFYILKADKHSCLNITDPRPAKIATNLPQKNTHTITEASEVVHINLQPGQIILIPGYLNHGFPVSHPEFDTFRFIHTNVQFLPK